MKIYLKIDTSQKGHLFRALVIERGGVAKIASFDIEVILLATGYTLSDLYSLDKGYYQIG